MPHLTLDTDPAGRPIVEIFVTRGAAETESLGLSGVRPELVRAMIDTGAGITIVERTILERLDLAPIGEIELHTVSSGEHPIKSNLYLSTFLCGHGEWSARLQPTHRCIRQPDAVRRPDAHRTRCAAELSFSAQWLGESVHSVVLNDLIDLPGGWIETRLALGDDEASSGNERSRSRRLSRL